MKHINIPEPCSEDWSKMTPNERGAFCQKCSKDVYDFTGKSADEIKVILRQNVANPVCMRIAPTQLDELNADFSAWKIQTTQSYQRAWLFTLLVVFGMTLFSCEEDEEPVVNEYQRIGQTILNQQENRDSFEANAQEKSADHQVKNTDTAETGIFDRRELSIAPVLGKPRIEREQDSKEMECDLGEVRVVENTWDLQEITAVREVHATAGVPMISPNFDEYLIETQPDRIELVDNQSTKEISGLAYPNPASTQTTLSLNIPKSGQAQIELFDSQGRFIRTIESGRIKKGESEYSIDLTNLETGIYLVVVQSGKLKETVKFSKI